MSEPPPGGRGERTPRETPSCCSQRRRSSSTTRSQVALDDVARRASSATPTLYRHFPTRGDLLVAVYADEVDALCRRGAALLHELSAAEALLDWLDELHRPRRPTKRALALAATESPDDRRTELFDRWHESMRSTAEGLLIRARDTGAIRSDLSVGDLLAPTSAAAMVSTGTHHARQLLRILAAASKRTARTDPTALVFHLIPWAAVLSFQRFSRPLAWADVLSRGDA